MEQLTDKIERLIGEYEQALSEKGLTCSFSKKYFEARVPTVSHHASYTLLDDIHRHFARRRESRCFAHQRNRYHCAVLCFQPADKTLLKRGKCKEYAFILYEISRCEEGLAPKERICREEVILRRIEKRLRKALKSAEGKDPVRICSCTAADYARYFFRKEYGYMKSVNGKDRDFLDLIFSAVILGIIGLTALIFTVL